MSISDLIALPDKLLPADENDPRSVKRYRYRTALVACSTWLITVFVVLPAMTIGLPRIGSLAWAGEVDSKIQKAIEPVNQQLAEIKAQLARSDEIQRRILQSQLAAQIRDLNRLRCATTDEFTRLRMENDIEEAQRQYRVITGERYPLPSCKEM